MGGATVTTRAGWQWTAMACVVGADFVLGLAAILLVPYSRPSGLVPAEGRVVYFLHAAIGFALGIGALGLLARTFQAEREHRGPAIVGLLGIVLAGAGGALTVMHGTRLVGMGAMLLGSPIAGFAYLAPSFSALPGADEQDVDERDGAEGRSGSGPAREVARVVLVDQGACVLLLSGRDPARSDAPEFWYTPGGGIEDGETLADAARRELYEETGFVPGDLGPVLLERRTSFELDNRTFDQHESYFFSRCRRFEVRPAALTELEVRSSTGSRWWRIDELMASTATVYPSNLAQLVAEWLVRRQSPSG